MTEKCLFWIENIYTAKSICSPLASDQKLFVSFSLISFVQKYILTSCTRAHANTDRQTDKQILKSALHDD